MIKDLFIIDGKWTLGGEKYYADKFNALIKKLKDSGQLDEEKLRKILKKRRKVYIVNNIMFWFFTIPFIIIFCILLYAFFANSHEFMKSKLYIPFFFMGGFYIAIAFFTKAAKIQTVMKDWKYTYLMTYGERVSGVISCFYLYLSRSAVRYSEYVFQTPNGQIAEGSLTLPYKFDNLKFKEGDSVTIAYDPDNIQKNTLASLSMELFNLKKQESYND